MSAGTVPHRLRRGFSDEAATAFADVVARRAATATEIDTTMASLRTYFSTAAYSVEWSTIEKFAWLFVVALKDANATQRAYWLDYVRDQMLHRMNREWVQVA